MAEEQAPASPSPGLPASPGGGAAQGSPVGVSPASQSTPNRGLEMAGLQGLGLVLKLLESLLPRLGSTSPAGKTVQDCIKKIGAHVEPGMISQAGNRNEMMNQMQRMQQMQMRMQRPQGGPPGAGVAPAAGGAMPPPPAQAAA